MIILSFFLSNWIFNLKLNKLNDLASNHSHDRLYLFSLRKFKEELSSNLFLSSKIKNHKNNCRDPACPCNIEKEDGKRMLKYFYEKVLAEKRYSNESLLYEDYLNLLIEDK
jgi:hypothetical protein